MKYYWFANGEVASVRAMVSRTGYTGEDGFEIFVPPQSADRVWQALIAGGPIGGARPRAASAPETRCGSRPRCGCTATTSTTTTTVLEADLGWIVGWSKGDFLGADVLRQQKAEGVRRKIVGFEMVEPGIARQGHDVYLDGVKAGAVTSGTQTPFLKKAIGMAYVPVDARGARRRVRRRHPGPAARAKVVPMPFYKRQK